MAFSNDVVGGDTLLRPAIRSPNYVPGVSGWTINRDGTSEFANGTFRGPVVVLDPGSGVVLASIGADGSGSFQSVYAADDVIIGTLSVKAFLLQAPQGIVSRANISGSLPSIPGANVFADICWIGWTVDPSRQYALRSDLAYVEQINLSNAEDFTFKLIVAQPGGMNATIYQNVANTRPGIIDLPTANYLLPTFSSPGPATIKLQAANDSASTAYDIATASTGGFNIWIEDIGPRTISTNGGSGTPAGASTFTKRYTGTGSKSYDSSGVFIGSPDGTNNMYVGGLSGRTHGNNENSLWSFNGTQLRSDISGATINSAKLWMYCTNSDSAKGSAFLSYLTNSSPPASAPSSGHDGRNVTSKWPVPGWFGYDILSDVGSDLVTFGANSIYLQTTGLVGDNSFYGVGTAGFEPYIEITYTV